LKLKHEKLLSDFAFNCNLRHYTTVAVSHVSEAAIDAAAFGASPEGRALVVGRCRLTPGFRSFRS